MDIDNRQLVDLFVPLVNSISIELRPAVVNYHLVEHDGATYNVLGALGVDLGLGGHLVERFSVDEKQEVVSGQVIVEGDLPLQIVVLYI